MKQPAQARPGRRFGTKVSALGSASLVWLAAAITACARTSSAPDDGLDVMPGDAATAVDGEGLPDSSSSQDASPPLDGASHAEAEAGTTVRRPIHGDYAAPLLQGGKLDIAATVARLAEAHVTTYAYLIYATPQAQWDALPAFLVAAAAKGIDVWVYLVPPTEAPGGSSCTGNYPPFQLDYVRWSKEIATLATSHQNLTAFAMDDFGYNVPGATCPVFSPAYVHAMVQAAHAVAPKLEFWPVMYWENLTGAGAIVDDYRADIAGIVFPYRDGLNKNTYVTASASAQIRSLGAALSCAKDRTSARARSVCYEVKFPASTSSTAGENAAITQPVSVGAGGHAIDFSWEHDSAGTTTGYVFAQLVVDGTVAWEADIGSVPGLTWRREHVVLDPLLAGKTSASVALRVAHKKGVSNFPHVVTFDEVSGTGITLHNGDFEGSGGWASSKTAPAFALSPIRTTSVVTMIYAATLSSDPTHPPTAAYVGSVMDLGLKEAAAEYADGVMLYGLDLRTPSTPTFTRVEGTYR